MTCAFLELAVSHTSTDESTSPARQEEQIRGWSGIHGHTVAHITMDLDVSGSKPAMLRPELGPWLSDPDKIAAWDVLVCAKLDRITRSTRDFDDLLKSVQGTWQDAGLGGREL